MQRLALFDLDRTLVDLDTAFRSWAREFAERRRLGPEGLAWLIALDRETHPRRDIFFSRVRDHFALAEPVEELWAGYRQRMPHLVRCYPGVLAGIADLRSAGWLVGIVTNGMADNQLGKLRRTGLADAVDGYAVPEPRASGSRSAACSRSPLSGAGPASPRADGWSATASSPTSKEGRPPGSAPSGSTGERGRITDTTPTM
ncbi:hypothetical protein GCM10009734_40600 [Nonomuraea bangladeshensis]